MNAKDRDNIIAKIMLSLNKSIGLMIAGYTFYIIGLLFLFSTYFQPALVLKLVLIATAVFTYSCGYYFLSKSTKIDKEIERYYNQLKGEQ